MKKMKVTTIISTVMKAQSMTQTKMAKLLGLKSQAVIAGRLRNGNITAENAVKMLDVLGYDLYAVPRGYGTNPNVTAEPKGYNKDHPTFTAEPMKLTVYDEGDGLTPDEIILQAHKATMSVQAREDFEKQPVEIQLAIAKFTQEAMKNGITKEEA